MKVMSGDEDSTQLRRLPTEITRADSTDSSDHLVSPYLVESSIFSQSIYEPLNDKNFEFILFKCDV